MLYPILTSSRTVTDLSGIWDFKADPGTAFSEKWYEKRLESPLKMPVPASYNDLTEDIYLRDHYGYVFYQRSFSVPEFIRATQRVVLRCDAVTHSAIVYINGREVCRHKGGFLPFEAEINEYLTDGENLLTIAADNRIDYTTLPVGNPEDFWGSRGSSHKVQRRTNYPNFDFFNYCGLTRPVRIITTPKSYIEDITLVPEVHEENGVSHASLKYSVDVRPASGEESGLSCTVSVFDRDGKCVATVEGTEATLEIQNVRLWQPLNAYLYTIRVKYGQDEYDLPYGIRTVEIKGTQFLINGKPFYFKGYGKHEDTFPHGRGLNLPMNVKDLSLLKWQGANSFRCSHYPYSEEMMRLADEEGFVVIDETTAVGLNLSFGGGANFSGKRVSTFEPGSALQTFEHHQDVIRDLISRDKNYASVVMWNIANEPDGACPYAYDYFKPLFDLARELDPEKRPLTIASAQMAGGPDTDVSAKLSDVICLNRYYGWYEGGPDLVEPAEWFAEELKEWEKLGKPLMITEYGADTVAGIHNTAPVMFTEEYQLEYYKVNNRVLDQFSFVVGEHAWNFADFAAGQGTSRVSGNKKGLFTRDRMPKVAAHYFKERWNAIPDFGYKTDNQ